MAKFDLSKKRKRKVKRKKEQPTNEKALPELRKQISLELIPISEQLPPNEVTQVIVEDSDVGWYISIGAIVYQHYYQDLRMFGRSRARYWALLE